MEGEDAWFCEELGRKVRATKRTCIECLPDTLVIHLKRFEYSAERGVQKRWVLPFWTCLLCACVHACKRADD